MENMQISENLENIKIIEFPYIPKGQISEESQNEFLVKLPSFDGHFEALLSIIEKEKIDIFDVSLSSVTYQYLEYLSLCQYLDLDYSSEFMLIISYLMETKSKKLLPIEEENNEIDEIENTLVDHVAQYRIFKKMAQFLKTKKDEFAKIFHRFKIETALNQQKQFILKDVEISDLVNAFRKVWMEANEKKESFEIVDDLITVEDKIKEITEKITNEQNPLQFESLFKTKTRIEIIVTFLAILELIRLKKIVLKQEGYFGKILIFEYKESIVYDPN